MAVAPGSAPRVVNLMLAPNGQRLTGGNVSTCGNAALLDGTHKYANWRGTWGATGDVGTLSFNDCWTNWTKPQIDKAKASGFNCVAGITVAGWLSQGTAQDLTVAAFIANLTTVLDYCRSIGMYYIPRDNSWSGVITGDPYVSTGLGSGVVSYTATTVVDTSKDWVTALPSTLFNGDAIKTSTGKTATLASTGAVSNATTLSLPGGWTGGTPASTEAYAVTDSSYPPYANVGVAGVTDGSLSVLRQMANLLVQYKDIVPLVVLGPGNQLVNFKTGVVFSYISRESAIWLSTMRAAAGWNIPIFPDCDAGIWDQGQIQTNLGPTAATCLGLGYDGMALRMYPKNGSPVGAPGPDLLSKYLWGLNANCKVILIEFGLDGAGATADQNFVYDYAVGLNAQVGPNGERCAGALAWALQNQAASGTTAGNLNIYDFSNEKTRMQGMAR